MSLTFLYLNVTIMLGYCRMNSRYWNSLSNEERKKITDEWENSQWKINSLDDSKNNIVLGTGYYILLVLIIFFISSSK